MIIFKSINKLNKCIENIDNIGFVPTMGSIHNGHSSLIKKSKKICKKTLVSIFVNPKQFNNKKDFINYPRNIKKDIRILRKLKVDYVLFPKYSDIYGAKENRLIKIPKINKILCAKYRPGHFEGVLQVINQYLIKIKVQKIFLGEKDYQQLKIISNFVRKRFNVKIVACKTIRHKNTFALSSRNQLLIKEDLYKLSEIFKILKSFKLRLKKNFKYKYKISDVKNLIRKMGVKLEYLELRDKHTLSKNCNKSNFKIFISYYYKKIRFIDNI